MRIVAGKYGSRKLKSPAGQNTRPTSDKVRGAVFSSLGGFFDSGAMLDCYSGSGAMAFEALSRGMDHAVMVDKDRQAIRTIKENAKALGADKQVRIVCADIFSVIHSLNTPFDLIYIDPPYAREQNEKLIETLDAHQLIRTGGIVVVESDAGQSFPETIGSVKKFKEKEYRNTKITMYQKEE